MPENRSELASGSDHNEGVHVPAASKKQSSATLLVVLIVLAGLLCVAGALYPVETMWGEQNALSEFFFSLWIYAVFFFPFVFIAAILVYVVGKNTSLILAQLQQLNRALEEQNKTTRYILDSIGKAQTESE